VLDREVIEYTDAGPFLGPTMAAAAGVVTWLALRRVRRVEPFVILAVGATPASYAVMVAVGALGYAAARSSAAIAVLAAGTFCVSPFVITAALLSGATVAALGAFDRSRAED
jgi:hypothetical protein